MGAWEEGMQRRKGREGDVREDERVRGVINRAERLTGTGLAVDRGSDSDESVHYLHYFLHGSSHIVEHTA